mmetsp:Transcript_30765/g.44755  ORF Transcript_30765/g.44755 Transcript_30765/m.44755 type:complete len:205 (+) Transcript_30765:165-779(+)
MKAEILILSIATVNTYNGHTATGTVFFAQTASYDAIRCIPYHYLGCRMFVNNLLKRVRSKADTICSKELVLELDPVKTKCVKETFQHIHHKKYSKGYTSKNTVSNVGSKPTLRKRTDHCLLPEHSSKLGVCKRKRPETKVGGSITNHTKDKFNSLNCLVNDNLPKSVFFVSSFFALFFIIMVHNFMVFHLLGEEVRFGKKKNGN